MIQFRAARHTNNIQVLANFYTSILQLEILGEFADHDGYNGVFIGVKGENWHLEFTENDTKINTVCDEEDLWVFYVYKNQYITISEALIRGNVQLLEPKNPYWKENGIYFKDPSNFGIVVVLKDE